MHRSRRLLLLVLTSISIAGLQADTPQARIDSVRIEGLSRTREEVVLDLIEAEPGSELTRADLSRIEERLIKSGLFASAEAELIMEETEPADGELPGAELVIRVEEKWTLVPIPFFAGGGDSFSGGLILLESNLFGRNKQLVSAGFGGSDGFSGFLLYADPAVGGGDWSFSISGSTGRSESEILRADGEKIRSLTLVSSGAGVGVGYRPATTIRTGLRLRVSSQSVEEWAPGLDPRPVEDGTRLEGELSLAFDDTRPVDVLLVGPAAEFAARFTAPEAGRELKLRGELGVPLFSTHRLRLAGESG